MVDSEQDQLLPIANVGRIMKQILPPTAKISKGAKETMQECVTEFIGFVTGEASDKCHKENRKTVNGDDICWALSSLGFDNYAEVMTRYMLKYREAEREKASNSTTATLAKGLGQGNDQRYHDYDHHHHHHYDHHDHDDDDDDDEGANQHGNRALTMPLEFRVIDPKG